jgi:hypothetical protein
VAAESCGELDVQDPNVALVVPSSKFEAAEGGSIFPR